MPDELEEIETACVAAAEGIGNAIASLIFTSVRPANEAVMLSHKNFTNMISMLSSVLDGPDRRRFVGAADCTTPSNFRRGFDTVFERHADHIPERTDCRDYRERWRTVTSRAWSVSLRCGKCCIEGSKPVCRERGDWIADLPTHMIEFNAWIRDNTPFNLGTIGFYRFIKGLAERCGI